MMIRFAPFILGQLFFFIAILFQLNLVMCQVFTNELPFCLSLLRKFLILGELLDALIYYANSKYKNLANP